MAKAGLASGFSTLVNPYSLTGPDFSAGLGALQDTAADAAMMRSRMTQTVSDMSGLLPMVEAPQQPAATQAPTSSAILYNPASKEFAVAGQRIASDDATKLLQSEALIGQPTPPDVDLGPGWEPVTTESYQRIIEGIKNPSFGTMFGKGFEIGTQNLKTLYGSALQSVTGGEYGGGMVKSAETELAKLQPYQRDVAEGVTADWLATSLGQQGPMILESALTMLGGAAVGSAAAGPGAGFLAGLAGLFGKKAVKEKILQAAAKYNTAKAAGVALNSTPELIAATKVLKQAGAVVGGAAASFAGNEVIAAGDIYSEGGSPVESWIKGVPYAALDLLPEAGAVKWALMGGRRAALPRGATLGQRALEYGVKRFGGGLALLGTAEGLTETAQEGIVLEAGGKDMTSPEALNRYLNSFAAGFAVGGLMGGAANLRSRPTDPTNLLDNPPPGTQGDLFPDMPVQAGPPRPPSGGGAVAQPVEQEVSPDQMGFDFGPQQQDLFPLEVSTPYGIQPTEDRRVGVALPEAAPGQLSLLEPTQDVLPFFEPGPELQQRMQPTQGMAYPDFSRFAVPGQEFDTTQVSYPDFAAAARASQVNPAQGALQFAPPAPSGIGFTEQQPLSLIGQRLLEAQQAQQIANRSAQRAAQQARDYPLAQAQQQLQLAPASEMGGWDAAGSTGLLPTVEARPTQPTQLVLPDILNQPRPTRAEKLKRGARPAALAPEVVPATPQELEAAGQLRLFDNEGEATVAAAKGAGLKRKRPKPKVETGAKQAPPTGKKVDLTVAAKKRAEEAKKAEAQADVKKDVTLVSERRVKDATGTPIVELTLSDGSVRRIQRAVGSQTKEGFTGWYDADLLENPKPYQVAYIADTKQGAVNRILADTNAAPTQEMPNAVQEQSPDEVSARSEPGTGEGVGPEVRRTEEPARKGRLRKTKEKVTTEPVPEGQTTREEEAVTPAKKSEAAPAAATEATPSAKGVTIRVRIGEGTIPANADEVLAKVDSDIDRYSALLECLRK